MTRPRPCINCGFCCRMAPCGWGERIGPKDRTCRFLVPYPGHEGRWLCGIYDRINGQPTSEHSPAFGAGCCSGLNSHRRAILNAGPFVIFKRWSGKPETVQRANQVEYPTEAAARAAIEGLRPNFPGREFAVLPAVLACLQ